MDLVIEIEKDSMINKMQVKTGIESDHLPIEIYIGGGEKDGDRSGNRDGKNIR